MMRLRPPPMPGGGRPVAWDPPRAWLAGLILLALAILGIGEARAHAQLQSAEPAYEAVVAAPPEAVRLVFNEPVRPLHARWISPDGVSREVPVLSDGTALLIAMPGDLGPGTHLVAWRVVSADGHPVGGTHVFSVGQASTALAPDTAMTGNASSSALAALGRFGLTLVLALGVGGAAYASLVERGRVPQGARALARGAALAVLPVGGLALLLHGLDLAGAGLVALLSRDGLVGAWSAAVESSFGGSVALAVVAGLIAAGALARETPSRIAAGTALLVAGASYAVFGHAARAPPQVLAAPSVALHAMIGLAWVGALPGLLGIVVAQRNEAAAALARFSALALGPVLVLVASGAILSWLQLGPAPEAILAGGYGAILLAKIALVALMAAIALANRRVLAPALAHGRPGSAPWLRRALRAELVLGIAALALVSALRATPPPRALAPAPPEPTPVALHLHGRLAAADVVALPGRAGPNRIEIAVVGADFAPLAPREVVVAVARPELGIERVEARAERMGEVYVVEAMPLPASGRWDLRVEILVSDFDREILGGALVLE